MPIFQRHQLTQKNKYETASTSLIRTKKLSVIDTMLRAGKLSLPASSGIKFFIDKAVKKASYT